MTKDEAKKALGMDDHLSLDEELQVKEPVSEWEQYVLTNSKHPYPSIVVHVSINVMCMLQAGASCERAADEGMSGYGITGFQAGAVASTVARFSPRGDEFRKYWNKRWGVEEDTGGVVNPAIVTLSESK